MNESSGRLKNLPRGGNPEHGLMHPIQVLKCCEGALAEREKSDPAQRWLWSIRRKVVTFCLRRLEEQPGAAEGDVPLSAQELHAIRLTHPLLQPRSTTHPAFVANADWMTKTRARVDAYLEGVRSRRPA